MSGALGFSTLICLHQQRRQRPDRNLAEPARSVLARAFAGNAQRRLDRALADAGRAAVRQCLVQGRRGKPVAGAVVDVWQSSTEGYYENQDPVQADMNLRGKFTTDKDGHINFRSIKPAGYPIPVDGPVGELLRKQGRHNMRPAHVHFLAEQGRLQDTDLAGLRSGRSRCWRPMSQFGVTRHLIGNFVRHERGPAPAPDVNGPWYSLDYTFTMEPGKIAAAAPADHRQGARRTAATSSGSNRPPCRRE